MDQPQPTAPTSTGQPHPLLYFALWQRMPAKAKAELLASWGYDVAYDYSFSKNELNDAVNRLLALKPAAILLSLDEFPGYTRQVALGLKAKSGLRNLPRIAVGGNEAALAQLKQALPDIAHCSWDELPALLREALGTGAPPEEGADPGSVKSFI
jgi:hypothetical protein